jgi:uncharacterized membrane protein YhaH (DUF805 family)
MNFGQAIESGFRNYFGFSGRAPRSEYWWWQLFAVLVIGAALLLDTQMGWVIDPDLEDSPGWAASLASLALLFPNLAMAVRRLHDRDKSGWWILLGLIPLIGGLILLVWYLSRGTEGENRFGPDPLSA